MPLGSTSKPQFSHPNLIYRFLKVNKKKNQLILEFIHFCFLVVDVSALSKSETKQPELSPSRFKLPHKKLPFQKRDYLKIDTDAINRERDAEALRNQQQTSMSDSQSGLNLDLVQMRLALGSEQLIREESIRTFSQAMTSPM